MSDLLRYHLVHQESCLGVSFFSPCPVNLSLHECLDHVRCLPNDEFMRAHVRPLLAALGSAALQAMFDQEEATIRGLILETLLLTPALADLAAKLRGHALALRDTTPQIFLGSSLLPDHAAHSAASLALAANIFEHQPLPALPDLNPDPPCLTATSPAQIMARLRPELDAISPCPRRPASETLALALERLYGLGIVDGPEMRHRASLAPWGLLRRWKLDRTVRHGAFHYRLEGLMTSYGRGLDQETARTSLAMEMVERYSSFADIRNGRISGTRDEIIQARHSELEHALDPNLIRLEAPYHNQPLHWMPAQNPHGQSCLVPVQSVYLFCNLDEIRLFSALGSTGLAAGNTAEEAKVSGLLEVIERDSEAVHVFDQAACFRLASHDPDIQHLLAQYQKQGIDPIFQDLTTELGVPCYKCFVLQNQGGLVKATGASLSGKKAALSALTEVPFPFPDGPPSAQGPHLPVRILEDLPEYETGSAAANLLLLEALLATHNLTPLYANLTKAEMRLPVYRAMVPGLEIVADFDRFTRLSPRLLNRI